MHAWPRIPRNVATIQMYGVSVDANEVMVYANFDEKAWICSYITKTLSNLKSEDKKQGLHASLYTLRQRYWRDGDDKYAWRV